jgi:hypothetical protein
MAVKYFWLTETQAFDLTKEYPICYLGQALAGAPADTLLNQLNDIYVNQGDPNTNFNILEYNVLNPPPP